MGALDIRIPERKLFVNTFYTVLSVAGKYAEGLIYLFNDQNDMTEELLMLKHMILNSVTRGAKP